MSSPNTDDDLGVEYYDDIVSSENGQSASFSESITEIPKERFRQGARTLSRIGETLIGLPGDVREVFNMLAVGIPEYFAGEELPTWRKIVQGDPNDQFLGGLTGGPTSQEIRENITEEIGGEYLKPQNKWEEFGDEIAQDFAALAIPVKGKIPFARALGQSVVANSGGELAKTFGGEKAGAYTKLGLLFTGGLATAEGKGVKGYINNLYKDMEATVPEGAEISAKGLSKKLNEIESLLKKGDPLDASKQPAFQKIQAIRNKIKDGVVNVDEVLELTKSTNESIFGLGELKRGQNKLYDIRRALHDTTKEYGSQNPEFLKKWQAANEAYAATETSRRVGNYVKKNISPKDYAYAASALGAGGVFAGAPASLGAAAGVGGLAATAYSAEVMKRISQSPALRKYYLNTVTSALNQNKAGFMRAVKQLDDGLKKDFEKEPYETVTFD